MPNYSVLHQRILIENIYEWQRWAKEIPYIAFRPEWKVRIIPPMAGAIARFSVTVNFDYVISVYLDCYDELGAVGQPYWEIYPDKDGDTSRYLMNDVEDLLDGIQASLDSIH